MFRGKYWIYTCCNTAIITAFLCAVPTVYIIVALKYLARARFEFWHDWTLPRLVEIPFNCELN